MENRWNRVDHNDYKCSIQLGFLPRRLSAKPARKSADLATSAHVKADDKDKRPLGACISSPMEQIDQSFWEYICVGIIVWCTYTYVTCVSLDAIIVRRLL